MPNELNILILENTQIAISVIIYKKQVIVISRYPSFRSIGKRMKHFRNTTEKSHPNNFLLKKHFFSTLINCRFKISSPPVHPDNIG